MIEENKDNLCLECPVRGRCCYLSEVIHGYNVIIDFQPCEKLDTKTGLCKDYENRFSVKHCKNGDEKYGHGGLPKECLYIQNKPELEPTPKINVKEVYAKFTPEERFTFTALINHPNLWKLYYKVNNL